MSPAACACAVTGGGCAPLICSARLRRCRPGVSPGAGVYSGKDRQPCLIDSPGGVIQGIGGVCLRGLRIFFGHLDVAACSCRVSIWSEGLIVFLLDAGLARTLDRARWRALQFNRRGCRRLIAGTNSAIAALCWNLRDLAAPAGAWRSRLQAPVIAVGESRVAFAGVRLCPW